MRFINPVWAVQNPIGTPAVQLNMRMKLLGMQVKAEAMLISYFWQQATLKQPERNKEFDAASEAELNALFAWERYITGLITSDCSALGGNGNEYPDSPCMPRSQEYWVYELSKLLDLANDDPLKPFMDALLKFFATYLIATLSGQIASNLQEVSSCKQLMMNEMRKRLRPLPLNRP